MLQEFSNIVTPYVIRFFNWFLDLLGADFRAGDKFNEAVNFFIYDTLKIIILLSFMIFIISYIRSYFPPEKVKKLLGKVHGIWSHVAAAILGVLSPF